MQQGFRNVRVQVSTPGYEGYGAGGRGGANATPMVKGLHEGAVFESLPYIRRALKLFERKPMADHELFFARARSAGLIDLIRQNFFKSGETVLFLHTGGQPALFAENYAAGWDSKIS